MTDKIPMRYLPTQEQDPHEVALKSARVGLVDSVKWSNVPDATGLESLIRSRMKRAPIGKLRITGYTHSLEGSEKPIFSFKVPLPKPTTAGAFLFSLVDSRAHRGHPLDDAAVIGYAVIEGLRAGDGVWQPNVRTTTPLLAAISAAVDGKRHFDQQGERLFIAPRPEDNNKADLAEQMAAYLEDVRRELSDFAASHRSVYKWLICQQFVGGWDLAALGTAIQDSFNSSADTEDGDNVLPSSDNDGCVKVSTTTVALSRLELQIELCSPLVAIRAAKYGFHQRWADGRNDGFKLYIFHFFALLSMMISLIVLLIAYVIMKSIGAVNCWTLGAPAVFTGMTVAFVHLRKAPIFWDSVGVSWSLKSWVPTGLPRTFSREEVLSDLSKRADTHESTLHLQCRTDGWYVLHGTREGDWLDENRDMLVRAIRERRNGDLTIEVEQEKARRAKAAFKAALLIADDDVGL